MKITAFALAFLAMTLGPSAAQQPLVLRFRSLTEVDCSAYQRQDDGTWVVLRANKIMKQGKVMREIVPGDDLQAAKLADSSSLPGTLDSICAHLRR